MGFIKILTSLFKGDQKVERPVQEANVLVKDLSDWFLQQTALQRQSMQEELRVKFNSIKHEMTFLQERLQDLELAKLQNESIPEKERQIMEGNRQAYIRYVTLFVHALTLPEKTTHEQAKEFVSEFEERLSSLTKTTAKSYYVLQQFFANESGKVSEHLKNIEKIVRSLFNEEEYLIAQTRKDILQLQEVMQRKEALAKQRAEERKGLMQTKRLMEDAKNKVSSLKKSEQYKELHGLLDRKKELESRMKHQENRVASLLAPLERTLRKYARISLDGEKLIKEYMETPFSALLKDKGLTILQLLQGMETAIRSGQLEVKDEREREKVLIKVRDVTEQQLQNVLQLHTKLKNSLQELEKSSRLNTIRGDIDALQYKYKHLEEKEKAALQFIDKLQRTEDRIDDELIKNQLKENIKKVLRINVTLQDHESNKSEETRVEQPTA
jgi:hypothetical protein